MGQTDSEGFQVREELDQKGVDDWFWLRFFFDEIYF